MRKTVWIMMIMVLFLSLPGCSGNSDPETTESGSLVTEQETTEAEETEAVEETESEEPEDDTSSNVLNISRAESVALGDTITLGDWEVTMDSYEAVVMITAQSWYFEPSEGNLFVVMYLTVTNTGDEEAAFLKSSIYTYNDVIPMLYYQQTEEISSTNLLSSDDDFHGKYIEPGETASGYIVFEVEEEVADSGELSFAIALMPDVYTCGLELETE